MNEYNGMQALAQYAFDLNKNKTNPQNTSREYWACN